MTATLYMKICLKCKCSKLESEFYKRNSSKDGLTYWCKLCLIAVSLAAQRRKRDSIGHAAWALHLRNADLKQYYGINLDEFEDMRHSQNNACAICKETPKRRLVVDHCHKTGKVRGLLCDRCNVGIGNLKDDPRIVAAALDYLTTTD